MMGILESAGRQRVRTVIIDSSRKKGASNPKSKKSTWPLVQALFFTLMLYQSYSGLEARRGMLHKGD